MEATSLGDSLGDLEGDQGEKNSSMDTNKDEEFRLWMKQMM